MCIGGRSLHRWSEFPVQRVSHAVHVHHVHALLHHWPAPGRMRTDLPFAGWPLGQDHLRYGPVLDTVIVDLKRPPGLRSGPRSLQCRSLSRRIRNQAFATLLASQAAGF